jgi:arylsulfatase A-like enzyme
MYEESLRTPLLVRWPGVVKPGTVDERIVSNVDFAPTFLQAAGGVVPREIQGRSMVPVLRGDPKAESRKSFYYHFYEDKDADHHVAKHEGVTNGRTKLIHFYTLNEWELYDLEKDPHELLNVYGEPEYAKVQAEMTAELERQRKELEVPALSDAQASKRAKGGRQSVGTRRSDARPKSRQVGS